MTGISERVVPTLRHSPLHWCCRRPQGKLHSPRKCIAVRVHERSRQPSMNDVRKMTRLRRCESMCLCFIWWIWNTNLIDYPLPFRYKGIVLDRISTASSPMKYLWLIALGNGLTYTETEFLGTAALTSGLEHAKFVMFCAVLQYDAT